MPPVLEEIGKEATIQRFIASPIRFLALAILLSFLVAPSASAYSYSWEKFKEDFKYKPIAFIVALPAFIITAPLMAIDAALDEDD